MLPSRLSPLEICFLRPRIGDPRGEVSFRWLPESLKKFFAARMGEGMGEEERFRRYGTGERVFGVPGEGERWRYGTGLRVTGGLSVEF